MKIAASLILWLSLEMAKEIERKFLVTSQRWREAASCQGMKQGYLARRDGVSVRVRLAGEEGSLTIKGPIEGISRDEFEYSIPKEDAEAMFELCQGALIDKTRYFLPQDDLTWEIDAFHGANEGLIVAEIELPDPGRDFYKPDWLGKEVTHQRRYFNAQLTEYPYQDWTEAERSP